MKLSFPIAISLIGLAAGYAAAEPRAPAEVEFQGVRLRQFQGSKEVATGEAASLAYRRGQAQIVAEGASVTRADGVRIRADHLTVLTKQNRGIWKGHVHAVRPATAQRPQVELFCDELVTDLQREDRLEGAVCTGNVQVLQGDRIGWGERAVYDGARGELVVTGNPRGQQGPSRFHGEKLTFALDSDRIEVEKPVLDTPAPKSASVEPASAGSRR